VTICYQVPSTSKRLLVGVLRLSLSKNPIQITRGGLQTPNKTRHPQRSDRRIADLFIFLHRRVSNLRLLPSDLPGTVYITWRIFSGVGVFYSIRLSTLLIARDNVYSFVLFPFLGWWFSVFAVTLVRMHCVECLLIAFAVSLALPDFSRLFSVHFVGLWI